MPYHSLPHYHLPRLRNYPRLLWSQGLGSFGASLATILVPIYFVKDLGMNIEAVLFWYLLFVIFGSFALYLGSVLASIFGSARFIAIGHITHAICFISILAIDNSSSPMIWVSALLLGITRGIYWPAYHAYFSRIKKPEKSGEQIGLSMAITLISHGLAPAIGGVIADTLGTNVLYGLAAGLLVGAAIPMIFGEEVTKIRPFRLSLLDLKKIKPDIIANIGQSTVPIAENLIWPLIIFYIVGSYSAIGALSSVVLIATIIATLYVGKKEKERGEKHFLKEGVALLELSHLLRLVSSTTPAIFVVNSIYGAAKALKTTPYLTRYYRHADEEPRMEYIFAIEMGFQVGQAIVVISILLLSIFLSAQASLLVGIALLMPLSLLILKIR